MVTIDADMETTTKKTPKITQFASYDKSPFTIGISKREVIPKADHSVMQDKETGKHYGFYPLEKGKTVDHDSAKYTKYFHGAYKSTMFLPEPANRMYHYILEHIQMGRDIICIKQEDYLLFAGYKVTNRLNYYRGIEGLLQANIIARIAGNTTCFYINPNIIFNGDRTKLPNVFYVDKDGVYRGAKEGFSFSNNNNQNDNNG